MLMGKPKIYKYQVRLTRDQYERLKANAVARGFQYLSSYVRFMALDHELWIEKKISEIHTHLLGQEPTPKRSKKKRTPHPDAIYSK